jgi:hypothetical protein
MPNVPGGEYAGGEFSDELQEGELDWDDPDAEGAASGVGLPLNMFGEVGLGMGMSRPGTSDGMNMDPSDDQGQDASYYPHPPPSSSHGSSIGGSPAAFHQRQLSGSDYYPLPVSMSAPSHKQAFDIPLQAPPLQSSSSSSSLHFDNSVDGGAVRRHRSMTPSMMRSRPGSSHSMSDHGGGGGGYHPYANARVNSSSSQISSAHSSPVPAFMAGPSMDRRRPTSMYVASDMMMPARPGSGLDGDMLGRPPSGMSFGGGGGGGVTDSPAHFAHELPPLPSYGNGNGNGNSPPFYPNPAPASEYPPHHPFHNPNHAVHAHAATYNVGPPYEHHYGGISRPVSQQGYLHGATM